MTKNTTEITPTIEAITEDKHVYGTLKIDFNMKGTVAFVLEEFQDFLMKRGSASITNNNDVTLELEIDSYELIEIFDQEEVE